MKLFSERKALTRPKTGIQVESMDEQLRNCLWNTLTTSYWSKGRVWLDPCPTQVTNAFLRILWDSFFKIPIDTIPYYWEDSFKIVRKHFFGCNWFQIYNFIEFVANNYPDVSINEEFKKSCNLVLERELSAYRFVGDQVTQITSKQEIAEVEEALDSPFETVNVHLKNALKLMSDRESPDYRNSIKESISSVEAMCRTIAEDDKATLGKALDTIEREGKVKWHGALRKAFDNLYGYTSSAEGIRHSLLDDTRGLSFEDAKFMLVSCSAFVNYLVSKASKAGLSIEQTKGVSH